MPAEPRVFSFFSREICVALAVISWSPCAHSQVEPSAHPELKKAVLTHFSFNDDRDRPASDTPAGASSNVALDSNIVVMEKFHVTARIADRELAADIAKTHPLTAKSDAKFGTGEYQKDFGKIRASAITILYVPIRLNASW